MIIHVCSNVCMLIDVYYFIEGTHDDVFVHFPMVSVSGWFLSIIKSAAGISFYAHDSEYVSKSGIPWWKSIFIFNLKGYWQSTLQSILCHFAILYFHQQFSLFPFLANTYTFKIFWQCNGCKIAFHFIFNLHFSNFLWA